MSGVNELAGKYAVVTGGSGGIGSAIVRSLQEAGAVATVISTEIGIDSVYQREV